MSVSGGGSEGDGRATARSYETLALNPQDWQIRLPTEWEWQWAAQGGAQAKKYPWGDWKPGYANTNEAGLGRAIAVGMYPHGRAECGALDMAGNLLEWCQNDKEAPTIITGFSNEKSKVLRGGSFPNLQLYAASSYRDRYGPYFGNYYYGVRLVLAAPMASLTSETLDSEALKLPAAKPPSKGGLGGIPPEESPRQRSQLLDVFRRRK